VATLAPLTIAELEVAIGDLRSGQAQSPAPGRAQLRGLHELLIRATPSSVDAPSATLAAAADLVRGVSPVSVDAMAPRPRTVFRLLGSGALEAAWQVLVDNATGLVDESFRESTATGAPRTAWRLPLLTKLEPPRVFADLPGFRDPRYGAPDDCYDITQAVRLRHELDEVCVEGSAVTFGGWCALDALVTGPDERVRVVASCDGEDLWVDGRRRRRPDLWSRTGVAAERRVWAGWSAAMDLTDPRLATGDWTLRLEVDHAGIVRSEPLGSPATELARLGAEPATRVGTRTLRIETESQPWRLVVTAG
jgi:hypothetical protein